MKRRLLLAGPVLIIIVGEAVQAWISAPWVRFVPFIMAGSAAIFILAYLLLERFSRR